MLTGALRILAAAALIAAPAAAAAATATAAVAQAREAIAVDRDFLIGRWTDNNDCSVAVTFAGDGRFVTHDGRAGLWHLEGDRLTMTGQATLVLRIVPIDRDTINVINPDGSLGRSTRC